MPLESVDDGRGVVMNDSYIFESRRRRRNCGGMKTLL